MVEVLVPEDFVIEECNVERRASKGSGAEGSVAEGFAVEGRSSKLSVAEGTVAEGSVT